MTASLVLLALALHAAPADPLAAARAAFAAGDHARAEALALDAAEPPHEGAALYLAALARFRAGRPADALAAFDLAARAEDPPERGPWLFNRAACLYALGRFAEAEVAFLDAADADRSLAAAARADAGFAALDAGAPARARVHAAAARRDARGSTLALVDELEAALGAAAQGSAAPPRSEEAAAAYRAALAAFDAGRFAAARRGFERAARLDPDDGRAPLMAGAAALRLGARGKARAALLRALALPLDDAEARIARDYLAETSYGLASRPAGLAASAHAGAGWDDNVLQSGGGSERAPVATGRVESLELLAGAAVAYRWRPRPSLAVDAGWAVEQGAYRNPAAEDYGLQQHVLAAAVEVTAAPRLRVGASASGEATFTGRSRFRALDVGPGAGAWLAVDAADAATTRVDVEWGWRGSPKESFRYLVGHRYDIALAQQLRLGAVTLDGSFRHRIERLGTLELAVSPSGVCGAGPCPTDWLIPFGSVADTVALAARAQLGRVQLVAHGGYTWRTYDRDSVTSGPDLLGGLVELGRRRRHDERAFAGAAASVRIARWLSIAARWDVVRSRSNEARGEVGHDLDYEDKSYTKSVGALEAVVAW